MCTTIATAWLPWQTWQYDSLAAWLHWEPWQFSCLNSNRQCWQLDYYDSLIALTAWMPWQLDCLDSSIALTARLLWQLDFLDSLNAFKLDCWNSLTSLQYDMCHEWICLSVKIILFTHNQFQLCCLKYWRIPSPLHCHCQPTSISYLCLCILQNVRILIIFISSVSTNSRLQLSCCLVCGVSAVSGLIQKWIERKFADTLTCTHSEYQLTWQQFHQPLPQPTTQMREQPK